MCWYVRLMLRFVGWPPSMLLLMHHNYSVLLQRFAAVLSTIAHCFLSCQHLEHMSLSIFRPCNYDSNKFILQTKSILEMFYILIPFRFLITQHFFIKWSRSNISEKAFSPSGHVLVFKCLMMLQPLLTSSPFLVNRTSFVKWSWSSGCSIHRQKTT